MTETVASPGTMAAPWRRMDPELRFRIVRWVCAFSVAVFLVVGFALLTQWNLNRFEVRVAPWTLWTPWDRRIPPLPWALWPYSLYYLLAMAPVFLVKNPAQLLEVIAAYLLVTVVAWVAYVFIPVRMEFPSLACQGLSCRMLAGLHALDGGVNVLPSLHAAHSVLAATIFFAYRSRLAPLVALGAAAVCAAAVLTRQHYLVDIPAGAALGVMGWVVTRWAAGVILNGARGADVNVPTR